MLVAAAGLPRRARRAVFPRARWRLDWLRADAVALQYYARQARNTEAEQKACEIRLRACTRMGELRRELETAQGQRTDLQLSASDGTNSDAIEDAGLSRRTGYRYEVLAGRGTIRRNAPPAPRRSDTSPRARREAAGHHARAARRGRLRGSGAAPHQTLCGRQH
jgi:hypothetical protein